MTVDRNRAIGLFFILFSLVFGIGSFWYPIGSISNPGPGLFPLLCSSLLGLIGIITLVDRKNTQQVSIQFRGLVIVILSLLGFALSLAFTNLWVGIVVVVVISSFSTTNSVSTTIKIIVFLTLVTLAFKYGLNLKI